MASASPFSPMVACRVNEEEFDVKPLQLPFVIPSNNYLDNYQNVSVSVWLFYNWNIGLLFVDCKYFFEGVQMAVNSHKTPLPQISDSK